MYLFDFVAFASFLFSLTALELKYLCAKWDYHMSSNLPDLFVVTLSTTSLTVLSFLNLF